MNSVRELVNRLESSKVELGRLSVLEACTGSFWEERFGERGRYFVERDALHHIDYLVSALSFKSGAVLANYARWLQGLLTVRGMCTRHIEEHFDSLAHVIRETIVDSEEAIAYLVVATDALRYDMPGPQMLQDAAGELITRTADIIVFHEAAWFREDYALTVARLQRDVGYLISYLIDAVALQRPEVFFDYLTWIDDYYLRRGRNERYLPAVLAALSEAAGNLPEGMRTTVLELIQVGGR